MTSSRDSTHFLLAKSFSNSQILFVQDKLYKARKEKVRRCGKLKKKNNKWEIGVEKHQNLEHTQLYKFLVKIFQILLRWIKNKRKCLTYSNKNFQCAIPDR